MGSGLFLRMKMAATDCDLQIAGQNLALKRSKATVKSAGFQTSVFSVFDASFRLQQLCPVVAKRRLETALCAPLGRVVASLSLTDPSHP